MGVIHLKTKHAKLWADTTIRRGCEDYAVYLDRSGEAYAIQKVIESFKDTPWAPRLRAKLREIVDAMVFPLPNGK